MAENVIRQDIIKVSVETDLGGLKKLNGDLNTLKKSVDSGLGEDEFENLKDGIDKSTESMKKAKNSASSLCDKLKDIGKKGATLAFKGLKKLASVSFKALAVGIAGVATALGAVVAKSASAFAEYEQLVGGVETLFKDSSSTVMKYANNAYKTAGLSANAYMETVTSFSASLLQSLDGDTAEAAKYADLAISDMSDNANKLGTDMSSIQYAYQGFAKQNYTIFLKSAA